MGLYIDLHVHTRRHSPCSHIDPDLLVRQALRAGLDGLVITEHQYQWSPVELAALTAQSPDRHFLLLAGFEYTTTQGDLLVYGLTANQASEFQPGLQPEDAVARVHRLGGVCIAAHPTRAGMGFDERILSMPVNAIEVQSLNLKDHEQRLASHIALNANLRPIAASDAHQIGDVGRYATEFDTPIQSMTDLHDALLRGTFRPAGIIRKPGAVPYP